MMAIRFFIDPEEPTLSRWVDHLDHAVSVMGVEHVGLGADFVDQVVSLGLSPDGKSSLGIDGFTRPDEYPALVSALHGARLRRRAARGDRERELAAGPPRDPARLDSPHGRSPAQRKLPLRPGPLRGHRAADHRELLPLHALPEAHRHCGERPGPDRPRLPEAPLRRGAPACVRAGRRLSEVLLLELRLRAVEQPARHRRARRDPHGRLRRRPGRQAGAIASSSPTPPTGSRSRTTACLGTPNGRPRSRANLAP